MGRNKNRRRNKNIYNVIKLFLCISILRLWPSPQLFTMQNHSDITSSEMKHSKTQMASNYIQFSNNLNDLISTLHLNLMIQGYFKNTDFIINSFQTKSMKSNLIVKEDHCY